MEVRFWSLLDLLSEVETSNKPLPMNSIGETCNEFKKQYESCFHFWFAEKFLKGDTNDSMCAPMFKVYQQCVKKAMKEQHIEVKDIEANYLGTGREKSAPPRS